MLPGSGRFGSDGDPRHGEGLRLGAGTRSQSPGLSTSQLEPSSYILQQADQTVKVCIIKSQSPKHPELHHGQDSAVACLTAQAMAAAAGSQASPQTRPGGSRQPRSAKRPRQDLLQQRWDLGGLGLGLDLDLDLGLGGLRR